jgi:hypothetical protein
MRVPDVVVAREVEQVVDQPVAVIVVDGAVGEHELLEAGQHRVARRPVDDHLVAVIRHGRVDETEIERDGVVAAERIDVLAAGPARRNVSSPFVPVNGLTVIVT